jgi:Cd2+/Zn2+-exporting ATPase
VQTKLANRRGVRHAVVRRGESLGDERLAVIELTYDPAVLSLSEVKGAVAGAGACMDDTHAELLLPVSGMTSVRIAQLIESVLNGEPGLHATSSYATSTVRVEFDRKQCALPAIVDKLESLGVSVEPRPHSRRPAPPPPELHEAPSLWKQALRQPDLVTAILGAVFLIAGAAVHALHGPQPLRLALVLTSYVLCGWGTAIDVARVLRQFKFDIDVLMFAAALGAAWLGHVEEGGLLLLLFALGGAGERLAIDRARGAISALSHIMPETALLQEPGGGERQVSVKDLTPGQRVAVRPGQRVPTDGAIVTGASAIDQSAVTGESVPVDKKPGDEVFAGTINEDGLIIVEVTRPASQTTLAKIQRMVEEAQTTKSPTQQFTDRVEKWYVPFVLGATSALIVVPPLLGIEPMRAHQSDWQGWFYQAMAFLTAASPCALAIGTPAAVLSGIARAARIGVLIKGGAHLENLSAIQIVAFDKTGTLTEGQPAVTDVRVLAPGQDERDVLAVAAAVERGSHHPLAASVVRAANDRQCPTLTAHDIEQRRGLGVVGQVDGQSVWIGRLALAPQATDAGQRQSAASLIAELEEQGKTAMAVGRGDAVLGVIAMADRVRESATVAVRQLRALGVRRTIMLTGDNPRTAAAVASAVGVDEVHAQLMPQDKLERVRELERQHGRIAMVGDGVNDAPALAAASVGIAMGGIAGGTDVALETADVALLSGNVSRLPEALALSRFSRRIVKQNLIIALGVIAVLAPAAGLGFAPISVAVFFHEGSTVLVVLNALRVLGWKQAD